MDSLYIVAVSRCRYPACKVWLMRLMIALMVMPTWREVKIQALAASATAGSKLSAYVPIPIVAIRIPKHVYDS